MKIIKLKIKTKSEVYPIIIGSNIVKNFSYFLKENSINFNKCLLVIDKNISKNHVLGLTKSLKRKKIIKYYFNASEKNKNQKNVFKILDILMNKNFSRQDCLISVGGGITGDVSGFAASMFKRGLQFINIPTTLLSQVDSSVGGKTGVNTNQGKNLIGSFYQPKLVISDTQFLKTLPNREITCGYGEILKHAIIKNRAFYNYLSHNSQNIQKLRSPFIEKAIFESCKIKKLVVEQDEKEKGIRKVLNFGHTFAHAVETATHYQQWLHGEAVGFGMLVALDFSHRSGFLSAQDFQMGAEVIHAAGLPTKAPASIEGAQQILDFMAVDKKVKQGKLRLVLLRELGGAFVTADFDADLLEKTIQDYL